MVNIERDDFLVALKRIALGVEPNPQSYAMRVLYNSLSAHDFHTQVRPETLSSDF
jgi:hypothetical protein